MKTYEFTYVLVGSGESEAEALAEALEAFMQDMGEPAGVQVREDDDEGP